MPPGTKVGTTKSAKKSPPAAKRSARDGAARANDGGRNGASATGASRAVAKKTSSARRRDAAPAPSAAAPRPAASGKAGGNAAAARSKKAPGDQRAGTTSAKSPASRRSPEPKERADAPAGRDGSAAPGASAGEAAPYADDEKFLAEQRKLLEADRSVYEGQALDLRAEADSLAQEREPGDVQFDEESGEGGTVTVDRERDLALSAQATAAVEEIDSALARIDAGTYGACERCHQAIPKPRLKALPYARLCVACKSGGLSRR